MKKHFLLAAILMSLSLNIMAQKTENKVPEKVKTAFKAKFQNAEKVEWEMENDSDWEAEFKMKGIKYSATFSSDGAWKETEYSIKKSEIPADILSALNKKFPGYKIDDAEIEETALGKFYEFELKKGKEEIEVLIDAQGNVVKKEDEKDEK